jgi:hypothetical protein
LLAIASTLAFGCNIESADEASTSTSAITEAGLVEFLNAYTVSTLHVLDFDCAIRSDSARYIDDYRRGPDLAYGTADDRTIDSEAELDSIYMVGPWTIDQLGTCAETFGYGEGACDPTDQWTEEGDVPGELEGVVEEYEGVYDLCGDSTYGASHFSGITITYSECGPVSYELRWYAYIDDEHEVVLTFTQEYDADFNLVDSDCDAG